MILYLQSICSGHLVNTPDSVEYVLRSAMVGCQVSVQVVTIGSGGSYYMIAGGGSGYVDHSIQSLMVGDTVQVIFDQKNSKYIYRVAVNNNEVMTSRPGDNAQGSTSRFNNFS